MSPPTQPTRVLVRVQAKGGKFLGPAAGFSQITLLDAGSGKLLAQGVAEGNSGELRDSFVPAATRQTIVSRTGSTRKVFWLSATRDEPTAGLMATLNLDKPTLVEFIADGLTEGVHNGHTVSQRMWVAPGADLTAEPGVVLVMPGLNVQIRSEHRMEAVNVRASVTLMCGSEIDLASPWLPSEFAVTAVVTGSSGIGVMKELAFEGNSTFGTQIKLPRPGSYGIVVSAVQVGEGNAGSAFTSVDFDSPY